MVPIAVSCPTMGADPRAVYHHFTVIAGSCATHNTVDARLEHHGYRTWQLPHFQGLCKIRPSMTVVDSHL